MINYQDFFRTNFQFQDLTGPDFPLFIVQNISGHIGAPIIASDNMSNISRKHLKVCRVTVRNRTHCAWRFGRPAAESSTSDSVSMFDVSASSKCFSFSSSFLKDAVINKKYRVGQKSKALHGWFELSYLLSDFQKKNYL